MLSTITTDVATVQDFASSALLSILVDACNILGMLALMLYLDWDFALVDYSTIDAIEVWNGRWAIPETANDSALALWTDLLDAGFRPTAVSGTDSHSAEEDAYVIRPNSRSAKAQHITR